MRTKDSSDDVGAQRVRSPMAAGFLLLGVYIAMYLAVAGFIRLLTPADAVAVAPNGPTMPASVATESKSLVDTRSEPSADGYAMHRTE